MIQSNAIKIEKAGRKETTASAYRDRAIDDIFRAKAHIKMAQQEFAKDLRSTILTVEAEERKRMEENSRAHIARLRRKYNAIGISDSTYNEIRDTYYHLSQSLIEYNLYRKAIGCSPITLEEWVQQLHEIAQKQYIGI